jgi:hypothetical protein
MEEVKASWPGSFRRCGCNQRTASWTRMLLLVREMVYTRGNTVCHRVDIAILNKMNIVLIPIIIKSVLQ